MKYKVRFYQNGNYEVLEVTTDITETIVYETSVFQGSLADCEAFIRLHENGYM